MGENINAKYIISHFLCDHTEENSPVITGLGDLTIMERLSTLNISLLPAMWPHRGIVQQLLVLSHLAMMGDN